MAEYCVIQRQALFAVQHVFFTSKQMKSEFARVNFFLLAIHRYSMYNISMYDSIREIMDINKDLVAASATPLVLGILAGGESYGYAILKRVSELSGGQMQWTDGMIYPLLHRLERLGHIEAKWKKSETGRKRKYYFITEQGREELAEQKSQWEMVDGALNGIWK